MTRFSKLICTWCENSAGVLEKDCHARGTVDECGSYAKLTHWPFWYTLKKYHPKTSEKIFLKQNTMKTISKLERLAKVIFLLVQSSLEALRLLWVALAHFLAYLPVNHNVCFGFKLVRDRMKKAGPDPCTYSTLTFYIHKESGICSAVSYIIIHVLSHRFRKLDHMLLQVSNFSNVLKDYFHCN